MSICLYKKLNWTCSQDRFVRLAKNSALPGDRHSPAYNIALRQRHAAILGTCALIESYPYTVEKWMPELLTNVLAEHTYDPVSCLNDIFDIMSWYLSVDSYLYDGSEVCEELQEDASRHLARRFKKVHGRATNGPLNATDWLILLCVMMNVVAVYLLI